MDMEEIPMHNGKQKEERRMDGTKMQGPRKDQRKVGTRQGKISEMRLEEKTNGMQMVGIREKVVMKSMKEKAKHVMRKEAETTSGRKGKITIT